MKLAEIAEKLGLEDLTPDLPEKKSVDVSAGHASDLLSDVLAHAPGGGVLVTIQVHMNVVAVSLHAGVAAVIFAANRRPDQAMCQKAKEEGIQLYVSQLPTFEIVGRLYALGVRGTHG